MTALYTLLAVGDHYPAGTCWAWMDSAERVCGRTEGAEPHLCPRHVEVARRKLAREVEKAKAQRVRREASAVRRLPEFRQRLAAVDAEIARRDPAPPTTDMAAYGGVGSTTASAYQTRLLSDTNVARLAELHRARARLAPQVAYAERVADARATTTREGTRP